MNPAAPDIPMTPMQSALATIKREHEGLATVLHVLWLLAEDVRKHGVEPDFKLFATILYYIAAFTERFHHPKEDDYLFKLLLSRTDRADAVIDELKAEHARGPELVGGLEQALVHYQGGSPIGLEDFARLVERYTAFIFEHMRKEERLVIPAAEKALAPADWETIDAAFRAHQDPLFGPRPQQEFGELYSRIAILAPKKLKQSMRKRDQPS